jgi:endogenous inhibitor of DNA gyrase (YacG/DUF329 family)
MIVRFSYSVIGKCEKCGKKIDLEDQNDDARFTKRIFSNEFECVKGLEVTCPHCGQEMKVDGIEIW